VVRVTNERELMRNHIEALFTHDADGRVVRVNEAGGKPAPRFFLGRTSQGNEWRFRHDVDPDLVRRLEAACMGETESDELLRPPYGATIYEDLLAQAAPIERVWAGPAYWCPPNTPSTADSVLVTRANIDVLQPYFTAWLGDVELCQPFVALVDDGRAVSVCGSVRITSVADEAGVETHRELRGRGYAPRVVSVWAEAVRYLGRTPLYSTSWQNTASQAVAAKLGLIRFGTDLHFT
jgi:RimJ/RimL family protein N-acetyltransferase